MEFKTWHIPGPFCDKIDAFRPGQKALGYVGVIQLLTQSGFRCWKESNACGLTCCSASAISLTSSMAKYVQNCGATGSDGQSMLSHESCVITGCFSWPMYKASIGTTRCPCRSRSGSPIRAAFGLYVGMVQGQKSG